MCGIAGFIDSQAAATAEELAAVARQMADSLRHRGPDDTGTWVDAAQGVALGHRRLSILDLSPLGHQPMPSPSGRYWLVYNGEIYNHDELRGELTPRGVRFRGRSDTETLLAAIDAWGLAATLPRCVGMFALALWDAHQQRLTLVRDRLGIKPLYYGWHGRWFLFGSELKALRAHPGFRPEVRRESIALLLQHGYVPTPHSIYRGIQKLPPGCRLEVSPSAGPSVGEPVCWWSLRDAAARGLEQPFRGSAADATDELQTLLRQAVRLRLLSDVPVGAFLSGGIDSSAVVSLMREVASGAVRTFAIGFETPEFNEAPFAARVARHLGTEHVEHYVSAGEALQVVPQLPSMFDEPFADSSQIPTYLVAQLTRQFVTVSLSGDGGDELFGGYHRYAHIERAWKQIGWLPRPLRRVAAGALRLLGSHHGQLLRRVLAVENAQRLYGLLNTHWKDAAALVRDCGPVTALIDDLAAWNVRPRFYEQMMQLDGQMYLPDDILTKVDRASMAVSLEARVPLLDHRIVAWAWSLPLAMKIGPGQSKLPLRSLLARYVPPELTERPKVGFGVPLAQWLRGELRDWAEALLDESRLRQEGFFHTQPIREKWHEHLAGRADWHYWLWDVLMFQAWLEAGVETTVGLAPTVP